MIRNPVPATWLAFEQDIKDGYYQDLNKATQTTHHTRNRDSRRRGGGGGGSPKLGGGNLQGANSIPNLTLPNTVTSGTPSGGMNPILIIVLLAAAGLGGWYWWHKAHLAAKQDQKASK